MAQSAAAAAAPVKLSTGGSIKETLESILIAFILAFVFRAFVVEAFVIPTGSMAPTLMGAHMRYRCPDCGWQFDVNYSSRSDGDDINIPRTAGPVMELRPDNRRRLVPTGRMADKVYAIICPNCGYKLPAAGEDAQQQTTNPPVHYGDRILVLKYLYLFQHPQRWDVVVFKSPAEPQRFNYTQNYIKRLIGVPGESIMVLDGDVYVGHGEQPSDWTIQTKPPTAQDALWRIIYDNDFYPQSLARPAEMGLGPRRWTQPWKVESGGGWNLEGRRTFVFDNAASEGVLRFDPTANPLRPAYTDWLAYDITLSQGPDDPVNTFDRGILPTNRVSDVRLAFSYQRASGDGPLSVQLSKRGRRFAMEMDGRQARLLEMGDGGPVVLQTAALALNGKPHRIECANVDYRLSMRVDGVEVLASTPTQYQPDMERLIKEFHDHTQPPLPEVQIVAARQKAQLSHISLWRDVYYINRDLRNAHLIATPDDPAVLKSGEYFVMGDNALISFDARYWSDPIDLPYEDLAVGPGRVPERFMLGKAFFVYWPAGFRPFGSNTPDLIPNFGEMRFIH